jgi:hypothetical protein
MAARLTAPGIPAASEHRRVWDPDLRIGARWWSGWDNGRLFSCRDGRAKHNAISC